MKSGTPCLLLFSAEWQRMQWRSSTGCTSLTKENVRAGPYHGTMSAGFCLEAITGLAGGAAFWCSWQPMQLKVSPGMAVNQLRIRASARPCPSST